MRNYQPKHNNPYFLPHNLYMHVLYLVRDYDRMKAQQNNILFASSAPDGMPGGNQAGDPTGNKALQMSFLSGQIQAIERALDKIPPEYRKGVFDNVRYGGWPYGVPAHRNTWSKWRTRFVYWIAYELKLL